MAISATQVKDLRARTGAGMMECKKALVAAGGDLDVAAEAMRREGLAKADKKAARVAAQGRIATAVAADGSSAVLLEVNCETDFVAKNEIFAAFVETVAAHALTVRPADVEALAAVDIEGESVEQRRRALIASLGENISVRRLRFLRVQGGVIAAYVHGSRIGSAVALTGGDSDLARDVAMHVAATDPRYGRAEDVPAAIRDSEYEHLKEQARASGKPEPIIEKMVAGRLRKYLAEITLLGQPFVKDPDRSVGELLAAAGAELVDYARFEVGEGIEKVADDFAAEVEAQARGALS